MEAARNVGWTSVTGSFTALPLLVRGGPGEKGRECVGGAPERPPPHRLRGGCVDLGMKSAEINGFLTLFTPCFY
ncbi:hypothetical protein GWI33_006056 [Rhynchophorus ferrugineus]|uniref:Uncharacterized protein n=1 Tax=Rhynchophorus ferrugineus TaxID=354439 RepID=A0A834IWA3_RHYFE|nr:hypothetical protein GWI33_006056 [Rhynchophorus ferrugineus]